MALLYVFCHDRGGVLDRPSADPADLPQRAINAAFRYALVRLRDAGEAIGFYRGERAERGELMTQVRAIIANYRAFVRREHRLPRLEQIDERDRRPAAD